MRSVSGPSSMTPDERLSEIASILADGVLRLHARAALSGDDHCPETLPNADPISVEVAEETMLSGNSAKRPPEPQEAKKCTTNAEKEVAALRRMTVNELRTRYAEVFGEQTNSRHKEWLVKRITWRKQALAEGNIPERARKRAAELANGSASRNLQIPGEPPAG